MKGLVNAVWTEIPSNLLQDEVKGANGGGLIRTQTRCYWSGNLDVTVRYDQPTSCKMKCDTASSQLDDALNNVHTYKSARQTLRSGLARDFHHDPTRTPPSHPRIPSLATNRHAYIPQGQSRRSGIPADQPEYFPGAATGHRSPAPPDVERPPARQPPCVGGGFPRSSPRLVMQNCRRINAWRANVEVSNSAQPAAPAPSSPNLVLARRQITESGNQGTRGSCGEAVRRKGGKWHRANELRSCAPPNRRQCKAQSVRLYNLGRQAQPLRSLPHHAQRHSATVTV